MTSKFLIASFASLLALGASTPASAAGNASAGLQALRELNLTVLGTLTTNSSEVEGRTFVGTLTANNASNFGFGCSGQGSSATSSYDTLDVANNATGSFSIYSGANIGANKFGGVAQIGGNVSGGNIEFQAQNSVVSALSIGGNLSSTMNVNNGNSVKVGGTVGSGANGNVTHDGSLAAGGANDVAGGLAIKLSALGANLGALSDQLSGLTSLGTITNTNSALDYSHATNGYAVFTMTAAAFGDQNANFDNLFTAASGNYTTIINVLGSSLTELGNFNGNSFNANQNLIWNFHDATSLSLKGFHGSVLAVNANLTNSSAIEGSIVAKNFIQGGEVHLGTYNGTSAFLSPTAVPEPRSWMMILAGFGLLGATMRRRKDEVLQQF